MAKGKTKMLFLTLHTFSLTGGIEKVSRILSKVLTDYMSEEKNAPEKLRLLSLCDDCGDVNSNYCEKKNFRGYKYSRLKFGTMAFLHALNSQTVVLSHINLLPLVYLVKIIFPSKRIILLAHGIEVWREISPWKKRFLQKSIEIWAVSAFTAAILESKHQIPKNQIQILNNCLDPFLALPSNFDKPKYLLERYQLEFQQPILMTISRLSSSELYKGYDMVIEVLPTLLKSFPNLVYILAGKADLKEKERLLTTIKAQRLEKQVILADFIPDQELIDHFLLADIFAMPSKKEGFGLVFIEAAACGCPVIAGNQDGSSDALLNGALGQLIDPDSNAALIEAVSQTLLAGKSATQSLSLQQKCLSHFGYKSYKDQVIKLLSA